MAPITIQQALDLAVQHHQAGRLREAETLYRQVLAQQPQHVGAMHLLGVIAHQAGRNDIAVDLIRRAILICPNFPEAHINLGNALKDLGQLDEALAAFRQAIALDPKSPQAHFNRGNALGDKGQLQEAIAAFRQAIALDPNMAEFHSNLGNALKDAGLLDEAIAACQQAIALNPNLPEAYCGLGTALQGNGQLDEAIAAYRRAIALRPNFPEALTNLGIALKDKGLLDEAIAAFGQAIAVKPDHAEAHTNLGNALRDLGQLDDAVAAHRRAIAFKPNFPQAYNNLGVALTVKGEIDEAVGAFRKAIALNPNDLAANSNLGSALKDAGLLDEAIDAFRRAIALQPGHAEAHSKLLLSLHYHPDYDAEKIAEEHRRWNRQHAEPLQISTPFHPNDRRPDRPLRIGYVSADFRNHACAHFLWPLLRNHDHRHFHITCYAQVLNPDSLTQRFMGCADQWRSIVGLSDEQVARRIRDDSIDILVDAMGHSGGNRLLVFAYKPAPIAASWMGYVGATTLSAIDYRITDSYLHPPGLDDECHTEESIRLPDCLWCYDPLSDEPSVNPLPALNENLVTFGCLNNFCKINEPVLELWARVLNAVDRSRLILLAPEGSCRLRAMESFRRHGIEAHRVSFVGNRPRPQYLECYHRVDIALDPFPYNGHTTSLDAWWMGVPVVTLVGQTTVGRMGLSHASNLQHSELAAMNPQDYLRTAVALAGDPRRLAHLRSTLRARMQQSPLMDAPKFARNIEAAYRQMWHCWCELSQK
jgi:protein O-GlcNAc transferase